MSRQDVQVVHEISVGRVKARIEKCQNSKNGHWYFDTRIFRPFDTPDGEAKSNLFGARDLADVTNAANLATAWIAENKQASYQEDV